MQVAMPAHLAQVCLFSQRRDPLKRFCDIVSGQVEINNGSLLSYHLGASSVAHHPPAGDLAEGDVLVTLQVESPRVVDEIHRRLLESQLPLDDHPENTEWGWRLFYFRAAPHLVFEVGAPLG